MQYHDKPYLNLLNSILTNGVYKNSRTGTATLSIFGDQLEFDLSDGTIPLLTTKRVHFKSIIHELIWFLSGSTNVKDLHKNGVTIWDEWAGDDGELGKVYGKQWRQWAKYTIIENGKNNNTINDTSVLVEYIDQIAVLIDQIKNNPDSRRLMVNAWNVGELDEMALPPCHYGFQCYVVQGTLSLKITQRSCDTFLGVPFNIAQYGMLLHLLAHVCDLKPGKLVWTGGDIHLYVNHLDQSRLQLTRKGIMFPSPKLKFRRKIEDIFDATYEDFIIEGYQHHERIDAPVSK